MIPIEHEETQESEGSHTAENKTELHEDSSDDENDVLEFVENVQ